MTERVPALYARTPTFRSCRATGDIRDELKFYVELYANKGKPHRPVVHPAIGAASCGAVRPHGAVKCVRRAASHITARQNASVSEAWSGGHWAACGPGYEDAR